MASLPAPAPAEPLEQNEISHGSKQPQDHHAKTSAFAKYEAALATLPREHGWKASYVYKYQGFWYDPVFTAGIMWTQDHFVARPDDIFLATFPKCGTTWLKALIFAIVRRRDIGDYSASHPLLTTSPHVCMPFLELQAYEADPVTALNSLPSPRLLATHIAHASLPESVVRNRCKIVYAARNPPDVLVSLWFFLAEKVKIGERESISLEEAAEKFCKGVALAGPFWDHVLGYYEASLADPDKNVLFLRYEEVKRDTVGAVKALAEFLGCPFSEAEERDGAVEKITELCSLQRLSNLEANKNGGLSVDQSNFEGGSVGFDGFFRKGKVGDGKDHLTPEMIERINQITEQKFAAYGLKL